MVNTPAYQFYPADLISDPEVMFWDMEMLGAYWQMINYLWLNGGSFDSTSCDFFENLRKLFRKKTKKSAQSLWKKIEKKFVVKNGIITHKRISKEMEKQRNWSEKSRLGGLKSAQTRKNKADESQRVVEEWFEPNANISSSSSITNIYTNNNKDKYKKIFNQWNAYKGKSLEKDKKKITWHSHQLREDDSVSPDIVRAIEQAFKDGYLVEDICGAINNYAKVLLGEDYFWSYVWGLVEFLMRGEEKHKQAARKWWRFLPHNFIEEHYLTESAKMRRTNKTQGPMPYQLAKEQLRKQQVQRKD